jgi:hypothetical protein
MVATMKRERKRPNGHAMSRRSDGVFTMSRPLLIAVAVGLPLLSLGCGTPENLDQEEVEQGSESLLTGGLKFQGSGCIAGPIVVTVYPGQSIQAAVKSAKPGTLINVKAGTYYENINLSGLRGTVDRPILLVSADGTGKAKIVGSNVATVSAWRGANVGVYGFHIVANTSGGDEGGVKFGVVENFVLAGNLITGTGQDGIKFFKGATGNIIAGNTLDGTWREEAMDNVSVFRTVFAYNAIRGRTRYTRTRYTSLTMKAASRDMDVFGNDFGGSPFGTEVNIGGYGNSTMSAWESACQCMAQRVHFHDNYVRGDVNYAGAIDSYVDHNTIEGRVTSGIGAYGVPSRNNTTGTNNGARFGTGADALPGDYRKLCPGRL